MRKFIGAAVVAAAITLPGVAGAQEYPLRQGELRVEEGRGGEAVDRVAPGAKVRIRAGGFEPGARITLTFESTPVVVATTTADAVGDIDVTVEVPEGAKPGEHHIKAKGAAPGGGVLVLAQGVTVPEGRGDGDGGGVVPFSLALGSGSALAAGGVVFAVRRRRQL